MSSGNLDELVNGLTPVKRTGAGGFAPFALAGVAVAVLLDLLLFGPRPDLSTAMWHPGWFWKTGIMGLLALLGAVAVADAGLPGRHGRISSARLLVGLTVLLAAPLGLFLLMPGYAASGVMIQHGMDCTGAILATSTPPLLACLLWFRKTAPVDLDRAAILAGATSAGAGAFAFVLSCPHNNPVFVSIWYGLAILLITVAARLVLPKLIRW